MILRLSFEELTALNELAGRILHDHSGGHVLAPPESMAVLVERLPLTGDLSVQTLADQRRLMEALGAMLAHAKQQMDSLIVDQYVGSEDSVTAFFDYANVLAARAKLAAIGQEMEQLMEIVTGETPSEDVDMSFPD
jgi:hypothetical protein